MLAKGDQPIRTAVIHLTMFAIGNEAIIMLIIVHIKLISNEKSYVKVM